MKEAAKASAAAGIGAAAGKALVASKGLAAVGVLGKGASFGAAAGPVGAVVGAVVGLAGYGIYRLFTSPEPDDDNL